MHPLFVGLDVGSRSCHQVVLAADGSTLSHRQFPTGEAHLISAFKELRGHVHVHLEAGELAPWVRSVIAPHAARVVVGHPRSNAWIAKDPNKCDRVDAYKLAELLRLNRTHEVYYPDDRSRAAFKQLVQHYDDLTRQQAGLRTKIKARLRAQGVITRGQQIFTREGREQILSRVGRPEIRQAICQLYEVLEQARRSQHDALRLMTTASKQFPEIARFSRVPGVGVIGACRFSAYVQTPHRFSSKRKLWRYCRLGVVKRSSDGKSLSHPRLDPSGCGRLKDFSRKAFEAALRRRDANGFKRAYERALEQTHNAVHARLSVQRKIVATLRAMWINGTPYRDESG